MSILGAWHTRVRSFGSDSRCALVTARVRAAGREFRRSFLAPAMIPQSPDVHRENELGRLARIGCSRPATLLNLMPIFFFASVFSSPSHPRRVELGGSESFANVEPNLVLSFRFWRWNRVAESCRESGRFKKDKKSRGRAVGTTTPKDTYRYGGRLWDCHI